VVSVDTHTSPTYIFMNCQSFISVVCVDTHASTGYIHIHELLELLLKTYHLCYAITVQVVNVCFIAVSLQ